MKVNRVRAFAIASLVILVLVSGGYLFRFYQAEKVKPPAVKKLENLFQVKMSLDKGNWHYIPSVSEVGLDQTYFEVVYWEAVDKHRFRVCYPIGIDIKEVSYDLSPIREFLETVSADNDINAQIMSKAEARAEACRKSNGFDKGVPEELETKDYKVTVFSSDFINDLVTLDFERISEGG